MKKFRLFASVALLAAAVTMTSCLKSEEDDIFDKSASERLEDAKKYYADILTDKGGKWQLEYFANADEHGYVYVMTFNKNGQVDIAGQNEYIGYEYNPSGQGDKLYKKETSLWQVVADNGPVLSFNSYNRVFHIFASPYDVPPYGENDPDESGKGHEGDYEFDLMKYSNDTLYLEGKKREIKMIMTRIDANTDDEVYMNYVTAMADSFFHYKIPIVFMNLPDGNRYAIMDGATQIVTMWDFSKDRITYETTHNAIVTHDGFSLMEPFDANGYKVQRFVRQPNGSLQCLENPAIYVDAGHLNQDVMFNKPNVINNELSTSYIMGWTLNGDACTGDYLTAYTAMKNATNKGSRRFSSISIDYADSDTYNKLAGLKEPNTVSFDGYVMVIAYTLSNGQQKINVILPLDPIFEGDSDVTFDLGEPTMQIGINTLNTIPEMAHFVELLRGTKFHLTAENVLAPIVLTAAPANSSSSTLQFVAK